jgi:hypothetical protein
MKKNQTEEKYQLTIEINNPKNYRQVESLNVWTDISPYTINVPSYILQYGFKYLYGQIADNYRFIPPHKILSVYYNAKPVRNPVGHKMFQL